MTSTATCCIFLKKTKQLDQDEIIEISDQTKAPCGVIIVTRTTTTADCREIGKFKHQKARRLDLKPKLDSERSLWTSLFFLKILMHSKGI
jgi:hypothetical protein